MSQGLIPLFKKLNKMLIVIISTVLRPGLTQQVDPGPGRPGAGTGQSFRKNRVRKNLV